MPRYHIRHDIDYFGRSVVENNSCSDDDCCDEHVYLFTIDELAAHNHAIRADALAFARHLDRDI